MSFKGINFLTVLLCFTIFAGGIASLILNWYSYNEEWNILPAAGGSVSINSTKISWGIDGSLAFVRPTNGITSSVFTEYSSSSAVWSVFKLVEAFVLIAIIMAGLLGIFLVVCFAAAVRNQLLFVVGMNVIRIALLIVSALMLAALFIALLGFLGLNNAASDDNPGCTYGFCRRISDSTKENLGTMTVTIGGVAQAGQVIVNKSFGPIEAWFIILGCIPLGIIVNILNILNKFPIPVDSVTIGEAL